jgi:hypothetical protein
VEDVDWYDKRTGSIEVEVQSTHKDISPVKQLRSHDKLAIRSVLELEPQNSHHSCNGTALENPMKESTKTYDEYVNNFKGVGAAWDEVSASSENQHSALRDALSSLVLSTELEEPRISGPPAEKVNSHVEVGSWASERDFPNSKPLFAARLGVLPCLSNDEKQRAFTQRGSGSSGSSGQSEFRSSKGANRIGRKGRTGMRKRLSGGGGSRDGTNDENDDGEDGDGSNQRTLGKSSTEYTKRGVLACPFYKNDPDYFTADRFHNGKYILCASRGFPDIARLK